jgi:high-affinity iron transporter
VVLVWVGIWIHGKSHADSWQHYVKEKLGHALSRKSGIFLLLLVFVVVYREVFETILFYAAIWGQGSRSSVVTGAGSAVLVLAVIAWLMLRYSRRLPISQFFRYSSWLIAVLAVALTGKAVSALQEAGYLPVRWLEGAPRIELLGLYPTLQGVVAQAIMIVILIAGFAYTGRGARASAPQ